MWQVILVGIIFGISIAYLINRFRNNHKPGCSDCAGGIKSKSPVQ